MKTIRVKFIPFEPWFKEDDNFIYNILKQRYEVVLSEEPDYLFAPIWTEEHIKYPNCVKIQYSGENLCPDFNMFDYAIAFEYLQYEDRYLRFPYAYLNKEKCELMENKHKNVRSDSASREFCNFIYSNGQADSIRERFFEQLSLYKRVDSAGKYRNNMGGVRCDNKYDFQKNYKFSIAFENSEHNGYVTEKIVDAFAAQTIPIYWGDPTVIKQFNPKAFINIRDFESIEAAIEFIKKVDTDEELYNQMLAEPAIINEEYTVEQYYKRLEQFLYHIFDQPIDSAYRHNRVFWGKNYQERMENWSKSYHELLGYKIKLKKYIPFARNVKQLLKKLK